MVKISLQLLAEFGVHTRAGIFTNSQVFSTRGHLVSGILSGALSLFILFSPMPALAKPATVQVCKQVLDDLDANPAEGGDWHMTVGDQALDLTGAAGVTINRTEDESAAPSDCSAVFNFLSGSEELQVFEQDPLTLPFEWNGNAAGYPSWQIIDADNPSTEFATGVGQAANLTESPVLPGNFKFSDIPDGTNLKVIYTNAEVRLLTFCGEVEDNGDATPAQAGTFQTTYSIIGGPGSRTPEASEGGGVVCDSTQIAVDFADQTVGGQIGFSLSSGGILAPGFPFTTFSDDKGNPDLNVPWASGQYSGNITGLEDDVTLLSTARFDVPRSFTYCEILEDNGDGENNGGDFQGGRWGGGEFNPTFRIVKAVAEDGIEVCNAPKNIPSSVRQFLISERIYPTLWDGNAIGYPKWELRDATNSDDASNLLASGVGDFFEFDLDLDTVNGSPPAATLNGINEFRLVFIHKEADFGNGADASTGAVMHGCTLVEDNADSIVDGGGFPHGFSFSGTSPIGNWAIRTLGMNIGTNQAEEGDGTVCSRKAMVFPNWAVEGRADKDLRFITGGWRGNAANFPRLRFENVSGTDLGYDGYMPGIRAVNSVSDLAAIGVTGGDFRAVIVNKAPPPASYQMCMQTLDNGLLPVNQYQIETAGPVFSTLFPSNQYITVDENGGVICDTPRPLSGWPGTGGLDFRWNYTNAGDPNKGFDPGFPFVDIELFEQGTNNLVVSWVGGRRWGFAVRADISLPLLWGGDPGDLADCEPFGGCDIRMTARTMTDPLMQTCKQVLNNGDLIDDSNTFSLVTSATGANSRQREDLTAAEGGPAVCFEYIKPSDIGAAEYQLSENLPQEWLDSPAGVTPGFPITLYSDSIDQIDPVIGAGSNFNVPLGCAPGNPYRPGGSLEDLTLCPFIQGDINATFLNRLGPEQTVQFCQEVVDNGDAKIDQGGTFTINGRHNASAGQFGDKIIEARENDVALSCSNASVLPVLATTFGGEQTAEPAISIPDWPGNAATYPQWRVQDTSGIIASGSGTDSGDISISSTRGNIQVIFSNKVLTVGELIINKTVVGELPSSGWAFTVTATGTNSSDCPVAQKPAFDSSGGSASYFLYDVDPVNGLKCTYTVTETTLSGWDITSLSCSDSVGVVGTPDIPNAQATGISLSPSDAVTCAFVNTRATGQIDLSKIIQGEATEATAWAFTLASDDPVNPGGCSLASMSPANPVSIAAGGGTQSITGLPSVNTISGADCRYSISESTQAGWVVQESNPQTNVLVSTSKTTEVTFNNVAQGHIQVTKVVVGDDAEAAAWVFTLSTDSTGCSAPSGSDNPLETPAAGGTVTFSNLNTHNASNEQCVYAVSETTQTNWAVSPGVTQGTLSLTPDDTNSVTFTNIAQGEIEVTKTVIGDSSTATDWTFTLTTGTDGCDISAVTPNPITTMPASGGTMSFTGLPTNSSDTSGDACQYSVLEAEQAGWAVQEANPQQSLTVSIGASTKISFTNLAEGDIKVVKTLLGATPPSDWEFTLVSSTTGCDISAVTNPATLAADASTSLLFSNLPTHNSSGALCDYTVSETAQTGWTLTDQSPASPYNVTTGGLLQVDFENSQWPDLAVSKTVNQPDQIAGGNLTFTVTVQNLGILEATLIELTDILPAGLSYVSKSPSQGSYDEITGVWDVGTLGGNSSASLDIEVLLEPDQAACAIDYANKVEITNQGEIDFDDSNHAASASLSLDSIGMAKRLSDASPIDMGNDVYNVTYELLLENNGAVDLINIQITDDLNAMLNTPTTNDATFRVLSVSSPNSTLSPNTAYDGTGDLNLLEGTDSLAIGAQGLLELEIEVIPALYYGPFENQASASGESSITGRVIAIDLSEVGDAVSVPDPATACATDSPTPLQLTIPTTPITLGWFRSTDLSGGQVLFEWSTESEVGNVGFYLWYQDEKGEWVKVNPQLIVADGDTLSVREYAYHAYGVSGGVYRITDVSNTGEYTHHGVYQLGEAYGARNTRKATNWAQINRESDEKQRLRNQQRQEQLRQRLQSR